MKTWETNTLIIGLVHRSGPMHLKFYKVHFYICLYPLKLEFEIQMKIMRVALYTTGSLLQKPYIASIKSRPPNYAQCTANASGGSTALCHKLNKTKR